MINYRLIHGNCMEKLKDIKEESVDLILTDPPYKISRKTNFHTMKGHSGTSMDYGKWDKDADILSWINELPRILTTGANVVIFNSWSNLGDIAKVMRENSIEPKRCLVLSKSNPAPFNRDRLFVNDVEFAVWGTYKQGWVFNRTLDLEKCVIPTTVQSKELHSTMKDLGVITKLVKILSNKKQVVCDPFMGSGTTGVACKKIGRDFIGIEIDDKYFNIARERIRNTTISML